MLALALATATETVEQGRDLPIPPWAFGLIAIGTFASLLAITYSFRSAGTKHGIESPGS